MSSFSSAVDTKLNVQTSGVRAPLELASCNRPGEQFTERTIELGKLLLMPLGGRYRRWSVDREEERPAGTVVGAFLRMEDIILFLRVTNF